MRLSRVPSIEIKTPGQLALMREAGLVVARMLHAAAAAVEPGISTAELDAIAEREMRAAGRAVVVQGLPRLPGDDLHLGERPDRARHPRAGRRLAAGDVISIDAARSSAAGTATPR